MGESGSGKTTAMRNLDPTETFYIDCDKKGLSWRGWKKDFSKDVKNYYPTADKAGVLRILKGINDSRPDIHVIVVDTINGIMVDDEMIRMNEKGYDKWTDLAVAVYGIINYALTMRDDMTVIFTAHTQTERDDAGNTWTRIKTSGKKLDKIVLESKFPIVLLAKAQEGRYIFETQAKNSTAKSPMGMLPETMGNDIAEVIRLQNDYYGG